MHREILGAEKGQEVDHINRHKLDNRKANLRFVTSSQNKMNTGLQKNNTSGYRGVCWYSPQSKWCVRVAMNGHRYFLGYYKDKDEAIEVARKFYQENYGEYSPWL